MSCKHHDEKTLAQYEIERSSLDGAIIMGDA